MVYKPTNITGGPILQCSPQTAWNMSQTRNNSCRWPHLQRCSSQQHLLPVEFTRNSQGHNAEALSSIMRPLFEIVPEIRIPDSASTISTGASSTWGLTWAYRAYLCNVPNESTWSKCHASVRVVPGCSGLLNHSVISCDILCLSSSPISSLSRTGRTAVFAKARLALQSCK